MRAAGGRFQGLCFFRLDLFVEYCSRVLFYPGNIGNICVVCGHVVYKQKDTRRKIDAE